jgi:hypothetical protein
MIFSTGERVLSPSHRTGTVQPSPWPMPFHTLIEFDDTGKRLWVLTELLRHLHPDWKPPKKTKHRSKSAAA